MEMRKRQRDYIYFQMVIAQPVKPTIHPPKPTIQQFI